MKGFATKPKVMARQNQVDKSKIDASINEQKAYEFLVRNQEAKEWIEDMIERKLPPGTANFADHLRDGVVLCELANSFLPGAVSKIHKPRIGSVLEFMAIENINMFFRACDKIKFPSIYMFEVPDLWEKKNVYKIVHCIHTLAHFVVEKGIKDVKIKKLKNAGLVFDAKEIEESKNLISKLEQTSGPITMSFDDDGEEEQSAEPPIVDDEDDNSYAQDVKDEPLNDDELADPDRCVIVKGELRRMRAGESNNFILQARDADGKDIVKGGEKFNAELTREATVIPVKYKDLDNGQYDFGYKLEKAGTYYLQVALVDQLDEDEKPDLLPIKGLEKVEIIVDAAEPEAQNCKVEGNGLESGVAGVASDFKLEAYDRFNNKCTTLDVSKVKSYLVHKTKQVRVEATAEVVNEAFQISYNCPISGNYELHLELDGKQVFEPKSVLIKDAGVSDPTKSIVSVTSNKLIAGQTLELELIAHDKHDNVRSSGGEKFVVELVDKNQQVTNLEVREDRKSVV